MLPIPKLLIEKDLSASTCAVPHADRCGQAQAGREPGEPAPCVEGRKHKTFKIPKYHGQKVDCIRQILSRDLEEGERNNSLFILYNLLLQNKNTEEYSKKLVIEKNGSLSNPLSESNLKNAYRKAYNYGCSGIRNKIAYIKCEACEYRFKDGKLKDSNILIKIIRILPKLSNAQRGIACLLGTTFEVESPSVYRIAKETNMDWRIVNNIMKNLEKKGFVS